jgi:predicted RNase H-like nuclease (RuvC/YqgF family)
MQLSSVTREEQPSGIEEDFRLIRDQNLMLQGEIKEFEAQLRELKKELIERKERISELEAGLISASNATAENMRLVGEVCEAFEQELIRIKAREGHGWDLSEQLAAKIKELMKILEGIEIGLVKLYESRRWRLANFFSWIRVALHLDKRSRVRGYWPIDGRLVDYSEWRAHYADFRKKLKPDDG